MVDLGFLLFWTFLISFSFHSFLFKNLQGWTLNGKIVGSFFSHPIILSLLLLKNLPFQLWMVTSCIPTFLMPFSFSSLLSNGSKNELWMGRCGGRGREHHKYMLNSKHPLKMQSFHVSRGYSKTCKTELRMVDLGFLLFSSRVPLKVSLQKPAISTLDGKILHSYFSNAIFLLKFDFKKLQEWTLDGQMWRKGQGAPQIHA